MSIFKENIPNSSERCNRSKILSLFPPTPSVTPQNSCDEFLFSLSECLYIGACVCVCVCVWTTYSISIILTHFGAGSSKYYTCIHMLLQVRHLLARIIILFYFSDSQTLTTIRTTCEVYRLLGASPEFLIQ